LLVGIALGPLGLGLLSSSVLSLLDPVVPVALAALGVQTGLGIGGRRSLGHPLATIAWLDAGITTLLVTTGLALVVETPTTLDVRLLALLAGLCAATSLTLPTSNPLEPRSIATQVIELNVLPPVVAGGFVLALLHASMLSAVSLVVQASIATAVLAAAGWLLLARASSDTEERVFAFGMLLLVGGVADYLSLSALVGGLVAGVLWRWVGGAPQESISRAVLFVQHPLLVLVLLVAGAHAAFSQATFALAAAYVLLRGTGKLAGGVIARGLLPPATSGDLEVRLLSPGIFGVGFALNAFRAIGPDALLVLSVVVAGTIGSQVLAAFMRPRRASE
jgi:hypothetical protein